jgi:hypothetical protein
LAAGLSVSSRRCNFGLRLLIPRWRAGVWAEGRMQFSRCALRASLLPSAERKGLRPGDLRHG